MQLDPVFKDWLARRKISESVQTEFGIHAGWHGQLGECIVIPVRTPDGAFSFNKYRRSPLSDLTPKYLYDKGSKTALYCADKIKEATRVLITEGEMDCLVAWSAHIVAVSSTGGSQSFQSEWREVLEGKEVVVCYDNDESGGMGIVKTLKVVPWAKILFLPDRGGLKDISDYVAGGGDLVELMKNARAFASIEEVMDDRAVRVAHFQSTFFHDAYIREHTVRSVAPLRGRKSSRGREPIDRAREFPISRIITFKANKALCPFHNEKTASFTYYKETNRCFCFGCSRSADAIDVYRAVHSVGFVEAVKALQ